MKRLIQCGQRKGFFAVLTLGILLLSVSVLSSCGSSPTPVKSTTTNQAGSTSTAVTTTISQKSSGTSLGTLQINYIDAVTSTLTEDSAAVLKITEDSTYALDIPYANITYRQIWNDEARDSLSEALWVFVKDEKNGKLGTRDNRSIRAYDTVQGTTQWIDPSTGSLSSTDPLIDMGYIVTNSQAYFLITQREAEDDTGITKSVRITFCLSVAQANRWQEMFSNFDYNTPIMVFLGDDVTAGVNATTPNVEDPDHAYPGILKSQLKMTVINSAVGGNTTTLAIDSLTHDVLRYEPAIVVINLGLADVLNNITPADTARNLQTIITAVKQDDRKIYLTRFYDDEILKTILTSMDISDADQMRLSVAYDTMFRDLSRLNNVDLITGIWDGLEYDDTISNDGIDPTAEGQKIMAGNFFKVLKPYLEPHGLLKN